jgi:hypothetical protein
MPELLRLFFRWCRSRCLAGLEPCCGSSACSGGVEGGSAAPSSAGERGSEACVIEDALRVDSDEALEEVVASRMYSMTSHVCRVASGAKDTRRFAAFR